MSYVRSSIRNDYMHYYAWMLFLTFPSNVYPLALRIFFVTFYMNLGSIANFVHMLVFYFKFSGRFYRNDYLHYIYIYTIFFLWYMNILRFFPYVQCFKVELLSLTGFLTDDLVTAEDNGNQKKYLWVCRLPGENQKVGNPDSRCHLFVCFFISN